MVVRCQSGSNSSHVYIKYYPDSIFDNLDGPTPEGSGSSYIYLHSILIARQKWCVVCVYASLRIIISMATNSKRTHNSSICASRFCFSVGQATQLRSTTAGVLAPFRCRCWSRKFLHSSAALLVLTRVNNSTAEWLVQMHGTTRVCISTFDNLHGTARLLANCWWVLISHSTADRWIARGYFRGYEQIGARSKSCCPRQYGLQRF